MTAVDLSLRTGLPLGLGADGQLVCGPALPPVPVAVRRLADLRTVLRDADASGPDSLYWMHRDVALPADRARLAAAGLRYDITVVRPGLLGREYVKTAGHYHPAAGAGGAAYAEVYEVAHGQALFLLQRAAPPYDTVTDVLAIAAGPGDRVPVPPGYGHVTVNPGAGPLVLTNLVAACFASVYEPFQARGGGACYVLKGADGPVFEPNPRYAGLPPLRQRQAPAGPPAAAAPLYVEAAAAPAQFDWLVWPDRFPPELWL